VQEASDIAVDVSRDDQRTRDVTVAACPDGCWLVLGEGHNEAWSATAEIDGQRRDLGAPELVDGGFNGWRLPPTETPTLVEIRWTAQGPVTWGLVVALLGAATLVAVVIFGRRRPVPSGWSPAPRLGWSTPSPARIAAASAIALVVAAGVFVSPLWSLLALPVAAAGWFVAARHRRLRVMELVGLGAAVATAIAVVVIERRDQPIPNAGWTLAFDHLNGLALFGLLAVAVGAAFGSDARGE
jgi:arabinofuranan 3-O-arabinosyltransferase